MCKLICYLWLTCVLWFKLMIYIYIGMDGTTTTSSPKKRKPRRFWNHREEVFLITSMKDVIASNPRWKLDNNQFRAGFYNECEKKILSAFPRTDLRATPHIDSKIKLWRKQYNTLQDMLKISDFGWDDEQKMVLVDSDDVWLNYVRVYIIFILLFVLFFTYKSICSF